MTSLCVKYDVCVHIIIYILPKHVPRTIAIILEIWSNDLVILPYNWGGQICNVLMEKILEFQKMSILYGQKRDPPRRHFFDPQGRS